VAAKKKTMQKYR